MYRALVLALSFIQSFAFVPNGYDPTFAEEALYYAYASYCNLGEIASWTCLFCPRNSGFQQSSIVSEWKHFLYVFAGYDATRDQLVISFRGTVPVSVPNWVLDIQALPRVDYRSNGAPSGSKVHLGFYNGWTNSLKPGMWPKIINLINAYPGRSILITGHSLGGALASIAALDISSINPRPVINFMSFGMPRWGNTAISNYFTSRVRTNFRVVNKNDPVPELPPTWFGYGHVSNQIMYYDLSPLRYYDCSTRSCSYLFLNIIRHTNYFNKLAVCGIPFQLNQIGVPLRRASTQLAPLLYITMVQTDAYVQVNISGPADRWFAVAFGRQMVGTNPWIFSSFTDGQASPTLWPYYIESRSLGGVVPYNHTGGLTVVSQEVHGNFLNISVQRTSNTTDPKEFYFRLTDTMFPVVYAYAETPTYQLLAAGHGTANRGCGWINFGSGATPAPACSTNPGGNGQSNGVGRVCVLALCIFVSFLFVVIV